MFRHAFSQLSRNGTCKHNVASMPLASHTLPSEMPGVAIEIDVVEKGGACRSILPRVLSITCTSLIQPKSTSEDDTDRGENKKREHLPKYGE